MTAKKEKERVVVTCSEKEARMLAAACAGASEYYLERADVTKMDAGKKIALQTSSEYNAISKIILHEVSFCENL